MNSVLGLPNTLDYTMAVATGGAGGASAPPRQ